MKMALGQVKEFVRTRVNSMTDIFQFYDSIDETSGLER